MSNKLKTDVGKALDSLSYLLDEIIALMDEAEKAEDWRMFAKYAQILQEARRIME